MKHIPLDSSHWEDPNGGKIIAIRSILMNLLHFKVLYYLIIIYNIISSVILAITSWLPKIELDYFGY